jgi:hypothetical protein
MKVMYVPFIRFHFLPDNDYANFKIHGFKVPYGNVYFKTVQHLLS